MPKDKNKELIPDSEGRHPLDTGNGMLVPPEGGVFISCPVCDDSNWLFVVEEEATSAVAGMTLYCSDCGFSIRPVDPLVSEGDHGVDFWPAYGDKAG